MRKAPVRPLQLWQAALAAFCSLQRIQFAAPWRPRRGGC
jgi:hypothetical protein